jgi:hypothetical protein
MIITMAKSRFMKVGIDNTEQFEDLRMSHVVRIIQEQIDMDSMQDPRHFYINKERMIRIEGVALKIKLNEADFEIAYDKSIEVPEKESAPWIKRALVGNIVKADLDEERKKETNSLDLMQNSSIIYHTESILEM